MHSRVHYQRLQFKSDIPSTEKHSQAYFQQLRVKKKYIYTGFYKKGYGKVASLKMVWRRRCQILEHIYTETLKLCGTLVMKTTKIMPKSIT